MKLKWTLVDRGMPKAQFPNARANPGCIWMGQSSSSRTTLVFIQYKQLRQGASPLSAHGAVWVWGVSADVGYPARRYGPEDFGRPSHFATKAKAQTAAASLMRKLN
jgi:hypothetical protein